MRQNPAPGELDEAVAEAAVDALLSDLSDRCEHVPVTTPVAAAGVAWELGPLGRWAMLSPRMRRVDGTCLAAARVQARSDGGRLLRVEAALAGVDGPAGQLLPSAYPPSEHHTNQVRITVVHTTPTGAFWRLLDRERSRLVSQMLYALHLVLELDADDPQAEVHARATQLAYETWEKLGRRPADATATVRAMGTTPLAAARPRAWDQVRRAAYEALVRQGRVRT